MEGVETKAGFVSVYRDSKSEGLSRVCEEAVRNMSRYVSREREIYETVSETVDKL
jgi:hypothetical protein